MNVDAVLSSPPAAKVEPGLGSGVVRTPGDLAVEQRIAWAPRDAVGLAAGEPFRAQVRSLAERQRSAQEGISVVQLASGALTELQSVLQRMETLAQAADDPELPPSDRLAIDAQLRSLNWSVRAVSSRAGLGSASPRSGIIPTEAVDRETSPDQDARLPELEPSARFGQALDAVARTGSKLETLERELNTDLDAVLHEYTRLFRGGVAVDTPDHARSIVTTVRVQLVEQPERALAQTAGLSDTLRQLLA